LIYTLFSNTLNALSPALHDVLTEQEVKDAALISVTVIIENKTNKNTKTTPLFGIKRTLFSDLKNIRFVNPCPLKTEKTRI